MTVKKQAPQLRLVDDTDADAFTEGMELAGRFLTRRARAEAEVRTKLNEHQVPHDVIELVLVRLRELKLVDDREFALQYIEERVRRRGLGAMALMAELRAKGVSREDAQEALEASPLDEEGQAIELAAGFVRKVSYLPLSDQANRIMAMLARRGIHGEASKAAVKAVLPPEGWD